MTTLGCDDIGIEERLAGLLAFMAEESRAVTVAYSKLSFMPVNILALKL